jgi:hypothetical protein
MNISHLPAQVTKEQEKERDLDDELREDKEHLRPK